MAIKRKWLSLILPNLALSTGRVEMRGEDEESPHELVIKFPTVEQIFEENQVTVISRL